MGCQDSPEQQGPRREDGESRKGMGAARTCPGVGQVLQKLTQLRTLTPEARSGAGAGTVRCICLQSGSRVGVPRRCGKSDP